MVKAGQIKYYDILSKTPFSGKSSEGEEEAEEDEVGEHPADDEGRVAGVGGGGGQVQVPADGALED